VNGDGQSATLVAAALEAAIKARAPGVHASTPMVRGLAARVCDALELDGEDRDLIDICVRVRDAGVIALPDAVVLQTGPLSPEDWALLNRHPVMGAELLEPLAGMGRVAPVVRSHHERWDGDGYPDGLREEVIPLLSRIIAACDAFVAIASDRPHRRGVGLETALEYLENERGRQLDARVVDALVVAVVDQRATNGSGRIPLAAVAQRPRSFARRPSGPGGLKEAVERLETVPAFGPAVDRVVATTSGSGYVDRIEMIAAIESDTGLTVAVLRAARAKSERARMRGVEDAAEKLTPEEIRRTALALPRAAFPWRTPLEAVLHRVRVHSQAVARAAERIARDIDLEQSDDLLLAALLHDVGKVALVQAWPDLWPADVRGRTPEQRVRRERQVAGLDHATVGGLLLTRWGFPKHLSQAVAGHHSADSPHDLGTLVRLVDMIARHALGDAVDRTLLVRLAEACGLPVASLRSALFELPHSGGSRRRRAEPSPLSARETAILRRLAEGKTYKEIALELSLAVSTIRTHLHNTYVKLGVADRAQAVLRATEMAWL
jgi:putative nucleotidyltransferase with HDIG domain